MNLTPTPKITAAVVGGAIATILIWVLALAGVNVPTAIDGAFATVAAGLFGWLTRDTSSPNPVPPVVPPPAPTPPTSPETGAVTLQIVFLIASVVILILAAVLAFGAAGTHSDLSTALGWGFIGLASFAAAHLPV